MAPASDSVPTIYTNSVSVVVSTYDAVLHLGFVGTTTEEGREIEPVCRLIMSPQHLKALSICLANDVREYEKHFGELSLVDRRPAAETT